MSSTKSKHTELTPSNAGTPRIPHDMLTKHVYICGHPGMGKTALLKDLFDRARDSGVAVVAGVNPAVIMKTTQELNFRKR